MFLLLLQIRLVLLHRPETDKIMELLKWYICCFNYDQSNNRMLYIC